MEIVKHYNTGEYQYLHPSIIRTLQPEFSSRKTIGKQIKKPIKKKT